MTFSLIYDTLLKIKENRMKLRDVVRALVIENNVKDSEIVDTIEFLVQTNILRSPKAFNKLVRKLNNAMEYENAQV